MVDIGTTASLLGWGLFFLHMIIGRFGGYQVVYYRARKIPYFIDYIRGPDKRYRRYLHPMTDMTGQNPPMYDYGSGSYQLPESEATLSEHGASMWFHAYNEFRAIPQYMDVTTVTNIDGSTSPVKEWRQMVPPDLIKEGFRSKIAVDINRESEPAKRDKLAWYIVPMLIIIVIMIAALVYYDYNTTCALGTQACPKPGH